MTQIADHGAWTLTLSTTFIPCNPELNIVVSEISPILSPKADPPTQAANVSAGLPPTTLQSHIKIGMQAAKVPHEVPVDTDKAQVVKKATSATVFPVTPILMKIDMAAAPTPVVIKISASAYANIRINANSVASFAPSTPSLRTSENFIFSVTLQIAAATKSPIEAEIRISTPFTTITARRTTGDNFNNAIKIKPPL